MQVTIETIQSQRMNTDSPLPVLSQTALMPHSVADYQVVILNEVENMLTTQQCFPTNAEATDYNGIVST